MQATSTNISELYHSPFIVVKAGGSFLNSPLHFHPEFELVYIEEGTGKRSIGSVRQDFFPGELLLIGPNVAHSWAVDSSILEKQCNKKLQSIVLYFDPAIFSPVFYDMQESHCLKKAV